MHAEWMLFDSALHAYSMVSVPLYDTLGPGAVEYIANHAELAAVGCSAAVLPTMMAVLPQVSLRALPGEATGMQLCTVGHAMQSHC